MKKDFGFTVDFKRFVKTQVWLTTGRQTRVPGYCSMSV